MQRQNIKAMLQAWELEQPGRVNNIFRAIGNVEPSHLADVDLYDFKGLSQAKNDDEDPLFGDIAAKEHLTQAKQQLFDIQITETNNKTNNISFVRGKKDKSLNNA